MTHIGSIPLYIRDGEMYPDPQEPEDPFFDAFLDALRRRRVCISAPPEVVQVQLLPPERRRMRGPSWES